MPQSCRHPGTAVPNSRDHCSIPALLSSPKRQQPGAHRTTQEQQLPRNALILMLSEYSFLSFGFPPRECERWGHSIQSCLRHEPRRQQPFGQAESHHISHANPLTKDIQPPKTFTVHTREAQSLLQYILVLCHSKMLSLREVPKQVYISPHGHMLLTNKGVELGSTTEASCINPHFRQHFLLTFLKFSTFSASSCQQDTSNTLCIRTRPLRAGHLSCKPGTQNPSSTSTPKAPALLIPKYHCCSQGRALTVHTLWKSSIKWC